MLDHRARPTCKAGDEELGRIRAVPAGGRQRRGDPAPETFFAGVDLGQSINHTAMCVMSKLPVVPDPERNKFFEPGQDPVDNRQEYRRIADEMAARATPDHPDVRDGAVEHVNGPLVKSTYAPGSLEWAER